MLHCQNNIFCVIFQYMCTFLHINLNSRYSSMLEQSLGGRKHYGSFQLWNLLQTSFLQSFSYRNFWTHRSVPLFVHSHGWKWHLLSCNSSHVFVLYLITIPACLNQCLDLQHRKWFTPLSERQIPPFLLREKVLYSLCCVLMIYVIFISGLKSPCKKWRWCFYPNCDVL